MFYFCADYPESNFFSFDPNPEKNCILKRNDNGYIEILDSALLMSWVMSFQNNILIIDARNPREYEKTHIRGAVNLPIHTKEGGFKTMDEVAHEVRFFTGGNDGKFIIVYCGPSKDCISSRELAKKLAQAGYANVNQFVPGLAGYGGPVEGIAMPRLPNLFFAPRY